MKKNHPQSAVFPVSCPLCTSSFHYSNHMNACPWSLIFAYWSLQAQPCVVHTPHYSDIHLWSLWRDDSQGLLMLCLILSPPSLPSRGLWKVLSKRGIGTPLPSLWPLTRCKSQRLSTFRNRVFSISQVPLDCPVCPAKPLFHPMSIWVDLNHFSAFPASFPSFLIIHTNLVLADQWLICCAYFIPISLSS